MILLFFLTFLYSLYFFPWLFHLPHFSRFSLFHSVFLAWFYFFIDATGIPEAAPPARPGRGSDWSCGAERRKDRGWEDQRTKGRRRMRRKDKRSGAMRRQPEPRKARRQVPYGILPCRPNEEKSDILCLGYSDAPSEESAASCSSPRTLSFS